MRAALSVLIGYATMFVLVFATFTGAYFGMGADGAFQPGTYEPSAVWLAVSFLLGLIAAVVGGIVAATIARTPRPPQVLAAIVLVLGLGLAIPVIMAPEDPDPPARTGEVGNLEAMQNARQPAWVAVLNAFVGAGGVLLGARIKGAGGGEAG